MVASIPKLGVGVYTVAEAAFYARMHPGTLARWLRGSAEGKAVLRPEDDDQRFITFIDFIEALAVRAIRLDYEIPLARIRQAVSVAEDDYGVRHPLAQKHVTYLLGNDILIRLPQEQRSVEDQYVQVSGKALHNRLMKTVVELYMNDVGFDTAGMAADFCVFKWLEANQTTPIRVMMNPHIRFGEPMMPCGYSAKTLWEASKAEGSTEGAAKAYGVPLEEVNVACRCYDHLIGRAAA